VADVSSLASILISLAQSNDLDNSTISKMSMPENAKSAITKWAALVNSRAGGKVASFDSIGEEVIRSKYSDDEREFFTAQYSYSVMGIARGGWLCIEGADVIGESADEDGIPSSGQFETARLPVRPSDIAPDGTDVRVLLKLAGGSFAHFELAPGRISNAVTHRTIEEIWYFIGGRGEMWRKRGDQEEVVPVEAGTCATIPLGTHFQFRSYGYEPLVLVVVTMPPWPGGDEAYQVKGKWEPTIGRG
jgi:mannose-6-phosphate isomerase-like protein (cupin superfamily)